MVRLSTALVKGLQLLLVIGAILQSRVTHTEGKPSEHNTQERIVLISFDGFRHDYIEREDLRHFTQFGRQGVRARSLKPTFVTKTFPNHFTIVTGLYEESHGIVSNYMYDPVYKETFNPSTSSDDPKWWNATTPLWMLNERHVIQETKNKTGKSATIFWPGSESSYNGMWPTFYSKKYDANVTTRKRFDLIVDYLLNNTDVNFVACYMEQPDKTAHAHGTESQEIKSSLQQLDNDFGYFIEKMKFASLYEKVNIILVSDHGFVNIPKTNVIYLDDYLNDTTAYHLDSYGTFLMVRPAKNNAEELYEALKSMSNVTVYHKKDIPEKWHYKHNRRVSELFVAVDETYYVAPNRKSWTPHADHGYDNELLSMHGIFLAHGPAFKNNFKTDTIQNIDLCALMCHILDVPLHPNNGTLDRIKHVLAEKTIFTVMMKKPALMIVLLSVCGIFVAAIILGCTVSCFRNFVESSKYRRLNNENVPLTEWRDDEDDDEVTEYQFGSR